ncbi:unnamed protein product [Peniophora sp. CBMAI 1063]|nr:unnamed protein product [Peniophora sp. CBMAI 1063]
MMFAARRVLASVSTRRSFATARHGVRMHGWRKPLFWGACFTFPAAYALKHSISLDAEVATDEVVDPDTAITFPRTLSVQSKVKLPTYTLLGCGVRTVSFLGIKVYSVGFYADLSNPKLEELPRSASAEEKIKFLVDNTSCLLRIIPTRNTSYTHLRDAFIRTLTARIQAAYTGKTMTQEDAVAVASPMNTLKSMFPNATFAKHQPLDIILTPPNIIQERTLIVRDLGAVTNDWVSKTIVLSYFDGQGNSPPMKKAVWESLETVGGR